MFIISIDFLLQVFPGTGITNFWEHDGHYPLLIHLFFENSPQSPNWTFCNLSLCTVMLKIHVTLSTRNIYCYWLYFTTDGHKYKCSQLTGHKSTCVVIHRNEMCITSHSYSLWQALFMQMHDSLYIDHRPPMQLLILIAVTIEWTALQLITI
jgi:hypothetical protein